MRPASRPLPTPVMVKVAAALLVCLLAMVSMHRPDLAPVRAVATFVIAWAYGATVLGRHLLAGRLPTSGPPARRS